MQRASEKGEVGGGQYDCGDYLMIFFILTLAVWRMLEQCVSALAACHLRWLCQGCLDSLGEWRVPGWPPTEVARHGQKWSEA